MNRCGVSTCDEAYADDPAVLPSKAIQRVTAVLDRLKTGATDGH